MLEAYFLAAFITIGLIINLGPQNIFLIKRGIQGQYILTTIIVYFFCEVLTISLGAIGAGYIFSQNLLLQNLIGVAGISFLLFYGYKSFRSAFQQYDKIDSTSQKISLKEVVLAALSFSLLNPLALMDTMIIIGGAAAQYDSIKLMLIFMVGSFTASTIWFFTIGFGSRKLQYILNTPRANKVIDLSAAIIMWFAAFYLTKTMILG